MGKYIRGIHNKILHNHNNVLYCRHGWSPCTKINPIYLPPLLGDAADASAPTVSNLSELTETTDSMMKTNSYLVDQVDLQNQVIGSMQQHMQQLSDVFRSVEPDSDSATTTLTIRNSVIRRLSTSNIMALSCSEKEDLEAMRKALAECCHQVADGSVTADALDLACHGPSRDVTMGSMLPGMLAVCMAQGSLPTIQEKFQSVKDACETNISSDSSRRSSKASVISEPYARRYSEIPIGTEGFTYNGGQRRFSDLSNLSNFREAARARKQALKEKVSQSKNSMWEAIETWAKTHFEEDSDSESIDELPSHSRRTSAWSFPMLQKLRRRSNPPSMEHIMKSLRRNEPLPPWMNELVTLVQEQRPTVVQQPTSLFADSALFRYLIQEDSFDSDSSWSLDEVINILPLQSDSCVS